jgi:hypothetical protein
MKATLRGPLLKVNIDVEQRRESHADVRCAATGPSGPTPDLGQSPLRVHRTTAWDGQALAIGGGRRRVHTVPGPL